MKSFFVRIALLLTVVTSVGSASEREEILQLLREIQPFNELRFRDSVDPDELRHICEHAKAAVPKLRPLIKVGSSVFDYPGLLSCGLLTYDGFEAAKIPGILVSGTNSYSYELHIGVPPGREGIGNTDFRIALDEKGIIQKVEDVDYRH